jgi:hypothetical protein
MYWVPIRWEEVGLLCILSGAASPFISVACVEVGELQPARKAAVFIQCPDVDKGGIQVSVGGMIK